MIELIDEHGRYGAQKSVLLMTEGKFNQYLLMLTISEDPEAADGQAKSTEVGDHFCNC